MQENDHQEVKAAKNWQVLSTFGRSNCVLRGGRSVFNTLQHSWQAQAFVRVCKKDFKKAREDSRMNSQAQGLRDLGG